MEQYDNPGRPAGPEQGTADPSNAMRVPITLAELMREADLSRPAKTAAARSDPSVKPDRTMGAR
ncbi:MAG: hypothetical protein FWG93_00045 [Oscillospiraceae bacterium]|nr:hypothetical protein [Oscillospiraceae bacterium]